MDGLGGFLPELAFGFEMTFRSEYDELTVMAEKIMIMVQTLPCAPARLDDLHLALLEALTNAIVHGNRKDLAKTISVHAGCDGCSRLLVVVTDRGEGFDAAALPDPTAGENVCADHGRGVFLMKRLVDQVEFNLGGRQVVLRKRFAHSDATKP